MDVNEFLSIAVVGGLLSLFIEWVTNTFEAGSKASKAVTLVSAIIVGALYVWVRDTSYFPTIITVLGAASIVYGFFLKKPSTV